MALADAAAAVSQSIQQILVQRELAKRQAIQDELARMRDQRADKELGLRERELTIRQDEKTPPGTRVSVSHCRLLMLGACRRSRFS